MSAFPNVAWAPRPAAPARPSSPRRLIRKARRTLRRLCLTRRDVQDVDPAAGAVLLVVLIVAGLCRP